MTTIAIVGAGPGLGAAAARRFGSEGFQVALVSRSLEHVDALAARLTGEGVPARGYVADVRDPDGLTAALHAAAETQGAVEVLQYSPLPHRDFLKPLAQTGAAPPGRTRRSPGRPSRSPARRRTRSSCTTTSLRTVSTWRS